MLFSARLTLSALLCMAPLFALAAPLPNTAGDNETRDIAERVAPPFDLEGYLQSFGRTAPDLDYERIAEELSERSPLDRNPPDWKRTTPHMDYTPDW
ncbi:hypothetical protein FB451DRAFT_1289091 [Mycena latifolia]|nr:hypothetical protein FB451DRAFT_1289091 [Mycena latifolia]